jgi:AAA ATPase domain
LRRRSQSPYVMPARAVIGRDEELAAIEAFLGDVEQGPTALVLSGEPGIGKTILWEAGVEAARSGFGRVLSCRGAEPEASLSFAGLSELLTPVFDDVGPSLLPPRQRALEVALLRVEPGAEAPDPLAIGLAVLDALSVLPSRDRSWSPSTTCSGSTRLRPARFRSRSGDSVTSPLVCS